MSEVKLHKVSVGADVNNVPDGWFRISPATTAEIMDAHPKCGWCISCNLLDQSGDGVCENAESDSCGNIVDALHDYCSHWEVKG